MLSFTPVAVRQLGSKRRTATCSSWTPRFRSGACNTAAAATNQNQLFTQEIDLQHHNLIKAQVCRFLTALCALGFSSFSLFALTAGQQTITTSTTPTALSCSTQRYVNKLTIRVLPGYSGKLFVGISGMNTSTYADTIAILYPNSGAHSEEYVLQDFSSDDGIDLCGIYVAGGVASEHAIAEYQGNTAGTTRPTYLLTPSYVAALSNSGLASTLAPTATYYFSTIRAQIIPGYVGKQHVNVVIGSSAAAEVSTLYPNSGTLAEHSAWSEFWEQTDMVGNNGLWLGPNTGLGTYDYTFVPDSSGEKVLVSVWRKLNSSSVAETPNSRWYMNSGSATVASGTFFDGTGGTPNVISPVDLKIRVIPGYGNKAALNSQTTGTEDFYNEYSQLFPNNTGSLGWSETESFGDTAGQKFLLSSLPDCCVTAANMGTGALALDSSYLYTVSSTDNSNLPAIMKSFTASMGNVLFNQHYTGCGVNCIQAAAPTFPATHVEVAVIPGGSGKIYVGDCTTMNTTTLVGVYAILYPNSTGRWSERLIVDDPEGDGIPSMCVTPQIAGEHYEFFTVHTGTVPADGVMTVKASGPLAGSFSSFAVAFASTSTPATYVRAQQIPGDVGKSWIGNASMTAAQPDANYAHVLKVLWPSEGNYNVAEGFSETYKDSCLTTLGHATNCLDLHNLSFWPYVTTEQLLVFALGR